ncbi:MAG: trehalose synthase [Actinobacteria bacterium HGW-Actinobacteria-4]|nr:MAG: trehalose synthase [Actinobacteria bacterium HGW-Actinobacteria-4]
MKASRTADVWWKNAIIYCLDVERYQDSNGDGVGDFAGLTERIEHLARLGVSCLWLMPFYPSPNRDDGYDITDYYSVDSRLGTLGDFVETMRTARSHGIRVIADLVVNHTSDQHPWFLESRSSKTNPKRDWYVWRDEPPADHAEGVMFPDAEDSRWTRDGRTRQHYLHHFYSHQPDLNLANPEVRDEIARVMGFWMELGLSGFRVDAVPYMLEGTEDHDEPEVPDPHDFLADLRAFMVRRRGDAAMLGEVNLDYPELMPYFGDQREELAMCFDFPGSQALFLALARQHPGALVKALERRPQPAGDGQWAVFLRNHDELTLDQLSESERDEVFEAFGADPEMQVFGRGLRRRLPTMMGGDRQRLRMAYSLLYSLPGTPVLFYGEEIGMAENLDIDGRMAVRTPMQWTAGHNAGFSTAATDDLVALPPDGVYGPAECNVEVQLEDPNSLLSWITLLIRRRRERSEFGWCEVALVPADHEAVFAHAATYRGSTVVAVHNFADQPLEVKLSPDGLKPGLELFDQLVEGSGNPEPVTIASDGTLTLTLERYGCRWLY